MFGKIPVTFAFLAAAGLSLLHPVISTPARAGEQPNILIMGEDADRDTVPRHNRVFNRVLNALINEMQSKGFKVYDETAVAMGITNPGRVRRTDAELITVARRVKTPPIDVVTSFQIYANAEKNPYSDIMDLRIRVSGRMLNVATGQRLGNYEVSFGPGDLAPLPVKCGRDCILENVGKQAQEIARDVGAALATKLDGLSPARPGSTAAGGQAQPLPPAGNPVVQPPAGGTGRCTGLTTAYQITFQGFAPDEVSQIESQLVAFQGYDHMRPVRSGARTIAYWYESCSDLMRLNRNLRQMLSFMGLQGQVSQRGNKFLVTKIAAPVTR